MKGSSKDKTIILILAAVAIIEALVILHLLPQRPAKIAPPPKMVKPARVLKLAIVLDDWGYNLNNLGYLDQIKRPLTISVLPHLPYSQTVADEAGRRGLEVILHLPLEPYPSEKVRLEANTIMVNMGQDRVKAVLDDDLNDVLGAAGLSNHMGSKATGDSRLMGIIFKEIKGRGLYFLDSLVSGKSVGPSLSRQMGVKFVKRDVFLDNSSDPAYIKGQISKLKAAAKRQGYAVGIGHDRPNTLMVLKEVMPQLEKEGYKFVYLSELTR